MKLVFATNNPHKLQEVSSILKGKVDIISLDDVHCHEEIPETADTLEENALLKAEYIYNNYHLNCFADDTGLEIEALNNEPGVYSARYAGTDKNPEANMMKVLQQLENQSNRKARFRTVIALIMDGKTYLFEGIVNGTITKAKQGNAGFGYDPIFMPEGYEHTFAELGEEVKNKISHRSIAIKKLCEFLNSIQPR